MVEPEDVDSLNVGPATSDSFLSPAKLSKMTAGSAIPSNSEAVLGTSPDLPHKVAKVGEVFSQFGSSISPEHSTLQDLSQSGPLVSFSDAGSSNNFRPDSSEQVSESSS